MKIRRLLAALTFACLPFAANAYTPDLSDLRQVPQRQVYTAAMKSAIVEAKHRPLQYAVAATMSADVRDGLWDEPEPGIARWRLRVASLGALSMSFAFESLHLPEDAELWIYTNGGQDVQGPYTAADNGSLWSPLVRAEEAVIEARMPEALREDFSLAVAQAFHGYRELTAASSGKSFDTNTDTSGRCEVNTACPQGDAWRDQIRATVLLTIDNSTLCSGTLVNNTRQDNRALVLSAKHCGISSGNVARTTVYFNVQKPDCSSTAAGPVTQNIAGRTLLASTPGSTDTDYVLFELRSLPPSSYNVHYAGWDIGSAAPQSGVTIHHPSGDDKKISTYNSAASSQENVAIGGRGADGFSVDAWAVRWASGTTEAGSSGAGLWSQSRRIVGTLSGGNGACGGLLNSTANNGATDFYARLGVAWNAPSGTSQTLKQVLDSNNSGCTALDGKDPDTSANNCVAAGPPVASSGNGGGGGGGGSIAAGSLLVLGLLAGLRRRSRG